MNSIEWIDRLHDAVRMGIDQLVCAGYEMQNITVLTGDYHLSVSAPHFTMKIHADGYPMFGVANAEDGFELKHIQTDMVWPFQRPNKTMLDWWKEQKEQKEQNAARQKE